MKRPHQHSQLVEQGFCTFENILDASLMERLRNTTDRLAAEQERANPGRFRAQGSMIPTTADPLFAELIALPTALDALKSLGYDHPTFTDGYVISKPPHSPRLFWHYDWFTWEDPTAYAPEPQQVFFMYYLSNTRRDNGCLRVIPGSHVQHNPLHDLLAEPHSPELAQAHNLDSPAFSTRPDEIDVPIKAGDLLIGDARILHATHPNDSDERRTVITIWFQPNFDTLPERIKAQMVRKMQAPPASWPDSARALVEPLLPRYQGTAEPYLRSLYRRKPVVV